MSLKCSQVHLPRYTQVESLEFGKKEEGEAQQGKVQLRGEN